jgi:hypothetical protein
MIRGRIILNNTDVDLIEDVAMPLNYAIADIRNPEKKNTNYSKTITLPGTANNNTLFGNLFSTNVLVNSSGDTNYTPSFNPNKKAQVYVFWDGEQIFTGYLKLDRIKVTEDYKVDYEVTLYGKLKDLFLSLGERTLADLDLSRYNHPYTQAVQNASWDDYIHKDGGTTAFNNGDGYVYPMADYALNNDIDYKVEHLFPSIYYKTIIREIVNQAGFAFDGDIFDNNDFKSLAVAYGGGQLKLSQSQIENRTFRASNATTISVLSSGTTTTNNIICGDDTTAPNNDAGGVYNTSTGYFTCSHNGTYKILINIAMSASHFPSTATATLIQRQIGWVTVMKTNGGGTIYLSQVPVYVAPTGSSQFANTLFLLDASPVTSGATTQTYTGLLSTTAALGSGDTLIIRWQDFYISQTSTNCYNQTPSSSSYAKVNITPASWFSVQLSDTNIKEGDTVDLNGLLPSNIKQKEFLSAFFKMFNIYTEDDRYSPQLMHMNTRPDFYATSGTVRDWSQKLDISQPYTIVPMGELDARSYLYKFKDDNDYWNDFYKKKYNETYGQCRYDTDNDWLTNINVTESIFSPTPLIDRAGSDRIIPRIYSINNNGQTVPKTSNMRLWYYGGMKTTLTGWNHVATSGSTAMNTFPYAGHLNDTTWPSYDVNFYQPIEVFYTATAYTNNNFFNQFHRQFIDEITDKDSKILQGYFHLTAYDIGILNFRDSFFILNDYWRLNKITDYNPKEEGKPTLCEFLKVKQGTSFVATSGTTNGGKDVEVGIGGSYPDTMPTYNERINSFRSNYVNGQLVSGTDNVVDPSATGIIVSGNNNAVGANCAAISIVNSSGTTVMAGVQNVSIINSHDLVIDARYNNTTVIDGAIYGGKKIRRKTTSYKGVSTDLGYYVLFEITGNIYYDLPEPSSIYNGWSVELKNNNQTDGSGYYITVNAISDATQSTTFEDGVSIAYTMYETESFTFMYRSGKWYRS